MSELIFHKTIRLAVSNDVRLTRLETEIIDTPTFQRLRQIKQLGPCHWVYPTAVHTRFDHSIGVLSMVDEMVCAINETKRNVSSNVASGFEISQTQRKLARLYGLLHDISHAPFGHTLEDELHVFGAHDEFQDTMKASSRFEIPLGELSKIGKAIIDAEGREFYDRFRDIYLRGKFERLEVVDEGNPGADEFIYFLVSDTVCADLLDYLKRDSMFCNLDLPAPARILNYLYVDDVEMPAGPLRRVIVRLWKAGGAPGAEGKVRRDVLTDLSVLLDSRYMLAERVYFHPAKLKLGTMIGRAALEAKRINKLTEDRLFDFGDDTFLSFLAGLDSAESLGTLRTQDQKASAKLSATLARKVTGRRLYKRACQFRGEDFDEAAEDRVPALNHLFQALGDAERRAQQEDEIARSLNLRKGDVLIYLAPRDMNLKVAKAIVDWRTERRMLSEIPEDSVLNGRLQAITNSHRRLWLVDIYVHPDVPQRMYRLVRSAFAARFGRLDDRFSHWNTVLTEISSDIGGNVPAGAINAACQSAAEKLANNDLALAPAHAGQPRQLLLDTVREFLPRD